MFNLLTLISGAYVGGKIIKESLEPEQPYSPPPKPVIPDDKKFYRKLVTLVMS